jgi:hypothetical protein
MSSSTERYVQTLSHTILFLALIPVQHDFKISSVLNALGDPQPKYPPFAGAIVFELHRIKDKNIVRAIYLDQTINWPYTGIKLPLTKCTQGGKTSDPSSFAAQLAQNITKTAQNITSKLSKLSPISIPKIPKTNKLFDGPIAAENRGNQECTFEKFVDSMTECRSMSESSLFEFNIYLS